MAVNVALSIVAEFDHESNVPLSDALATLRLSDASEADLNRYALERSKLALMGIAFDCGLIVLDGRVAKGGH